MVHICNLFSVCWCAELQDTVMGLGPVKKKIYKTVSEKVQKQTKGLYPAPVKIIEVRNQEHQNQKGCGRTSTFSRDAHMCAPLSCL